MGRTAEKPPGRIAGLPGSLLLPRPILTALAFAAHAKEGRVDPDSWRRADTSSPRDTRSISVSDSNAFSADYQGREASDESYRAYRCASQTFDFGSTLGGERWFVRNERTALLQELLPRVELPAQKEAPVDGEVAVSDLRPWMIPSTPIAIEKIEAGPRSLFSANLIGGRSICCPGRLLPPPGSMSKSLLPAGCRTATSIRSYR